MVKNPPAMQEIWFNPWVGTTPVEKGMATPPVFCLGEVRGQRSLAVCSPCGHKELDTTEQLSLSHLGIFGLCKTDMFHH